MVVIGPTRTGWLEMSEWEESQTSQPERINRELGTSLPYLPGSNLLMRLTETQNKLLFVGYIFIFFIFIYLLF